jgi:hypothetical protein
MEMAEEEKTATATPTGEATAAQQPSTQKKWPNQRVQNQTHQP